MMRPVYDATAIRAAEAKLFETRDPLLVMQDAAGQVANVVRQILQTQHKRVTGSKVVLLVGPGNNGGDALYAGAILARRGVAVTALTTESTCHEGGAHALVAAGGQLISVASVIPGMADQALTQADVVVDGIFGIGGYGSLRGTAAEAVARIADGVAVVAVDLPSGVAESPDSSTGVTAAVTVTFACLKPQLLHSPVRDQSGVVVVADIGLESALMDQPHVAQVLDERDVALILGRAMNQRDSYKYSHGVVGVAAGSAQYPGAAHLVVGAARHSGVGMVRCWGGEPAVAAAVISRFPDVVSGAMDPGEDERATGWVVGPGFGTKDDSARVLREVLATSLPVVVDADALTMVAQHSDLREIIRDRPAVTVVTPHIGEFTRLGFDPDPDRIAAAKHAAHELGAIMVLKGPGTIVASPDDEVYVDLMGTSALATAGTGDVLAGLIAGVIADPATRDVSSAAVAAAVYVHGLAGRIATADNQPMTSWDLVAAVPKAMATVREQPQL